MTLVVSDSSPLNFLVRLGCIDILPKLFQAVVIPPAVAAELSRPSTPPEVTAFILDPPKWLAIRAPSRIERIPRLHAGEEAAIALAHEVQADLILLDDGRAREAAALRGLVVTGLLGVLERASERGLLDLAEVARRLPSDYRIDPALVRAALEREAERRAKRSR